MRTVTLPSGDRVPALGQGTWHLAEQPERHSEEVRALRAGLDLGMTLIDTAEMYGDGTSEELTGEAISGHRDEVFLVSKVLPSNASVTGTVRACEDSLRRLGTDRLDLYLLHWRGGHPLRETVEAFERLLADGKIRSWGVSNFDVADLRELETVPGAAGVVTDQVLYNLTRRGVEYDLLPHCRQRGLPVMAYSPIEQARLLRRPELRRVAERHAASPAQVALAWVLRQPETLAIPKAGSIDHVRDNRAALDLHLTEQDIGELDEAFPAPSRKQPLEIL